MSNYWGSDHSAGFSQLRLILLRLHYGSLKMQTNLKIHLNSSTIKENVNHPETQWLKPSEVARLIGLDEKWLAAAREGRKDITGPPFIKIGSGKTSPIRYPIDELINWMNSFPIYNSNYSNLDFTRFSRRL